MGAHLGSQARAAAQLRGVRVARIPNPPNPNPNPSPRPRPSPLLIPIPNPLTLGRADAKDTLWPGHFHRYRGGRAPDFEERWQNHTELSLRLASPGGADTVEAACGPVAGAVADTS